MVAPNDQKVAELTASVNDQLAGLQANEKQPILSALTDVLFRAQRPGFSGQTLEVPGEQAVLEGERLAEQLGTRYRTDGQTNAYLFARGSESGSGPVMYQDKNSGEVFVLLERPIRNADRWEFPAGYRNAPNETATGEVEAEAKNTQPPTPENLQAMFAAELSTMQAEKKTAREILDRFEDPLELQAMFDKHGIEWNPALDPNAEAALRREVQEETGLTLPKDGVEFVRSVTTASFAGSGRVNHTDHVYMADLGQLEKAPELTPQESEIAEAKWVSLKDIQRDQNGAYKVGDLQLNPDQAPRLEMALEAYADRKVKQASAVPVQGGSVSEFDSARDVVAEARIEAAKQQAPMTGDLATLLNSADLQGNFKSLVGAEGQKRLSLLIIAADGLANDTPLNQLFAGNELPAPSQTVSNVTTSQNAALPAQSRAGTPAQTRR